MARFKYTILLLAGIFFLVSCDYGTPISEGTSSRESGGVISVKTIVFTGDSITDSGRDKTIEPQMELGNGYVEMISRSIVSEYGEDAPLILNSGVSGNTIQQLYNRFPSDVDAFSPDWVVILIGINDAYNQWSAQSTTHSPEIFKKYLARIFHDYAYMYKKVFLVTPFYIEEHSVSEKRTQYLDAYLEVLHEMANSNSNTVLVDVQKLFDNQLAKIGAGKFALLSPDHVHLTNAGNQIIVDALLKAFKEN
ncbi:MAG: SGNH/GDSL hydrolase family protein [Saccharofermentanales bacterium]